MNLARMMGKGASNESIYSISQLLLIQIAGIWSPLGLHFRALELPMAHVSVTVVDHSHLHDLVASNERR